ncbi:MAG: phospholipase D-like domain-containing protein, partial [Proteobacteria bacterium]|nr:phospholipase D-like domain-containing protein [Pseudomonadota bacterium]
MLSNLMLSNLKIFFMYSLSLGTSAHALDISESAVRCEIGQKIALIAFLRSTIMSKVLSLFLGITLFSLQPLSVYAASATPTLKAVPGESYLTELQNLIQSARSSVTILHFNFFTESGETKKLAELLKSRKRQSPNLAVDIILEGEKDLDKENGAATRNHLTKNFFEGSGVNVRFISGLRQEGKKPGVTHAKAVVIDDVLLTGSTNLTNTSLTKNNEFNVAIHDPKAANFARAYVQAILKKSTVLYPNALALEQASILTDNAFLPEALKVINEATLGETLNVATYFFRVAGEDDQDADKILSAVLQAKTRGAKIKFYLERNNNPQVNPDITRSNMNVAEKLSKAGIDVYFDPQEKISHAKMILLDGKRKILLQGSSNLFRGDLNENHQINIRIDDASIVAKAQSWLSAKIAYEGSQYGAIAAGKPLAKMFRLWFGYAQNRSDLSSLTIGVNQKLVPATTQYAKGRGLDAYLPALLKSEYSHPELPDEVAVIAYKNADMYDAARLTPPYGPKYGPLHFSEGLFAKETDGGFQSGSAVARPFERASFKVEKGLSAYQVNAGLVDWQTGSTTLYVLKTPSSISFEKAACTILAYV